MLRPSAILGVLFAVATFTCPAFASGDSPVDTGNRSESPQAMMERILESKRTDAAQEDVVARFVKVGDFEFQLEQKLGKARFIIDRYENFDGKTTLYSYKSFSVQCIGGKVTVVTLRRTRKAN